MTKMLYWLVKVTRQGTRSVFLPFVSLKIEFKIEKPGHLVSNIWIRNRYFVWRSLFVTMGIICLCGIHPSTMQKRLLGVVIKINVSYYFYQVDVRSN